MNGTGGRDRYRARPALALIVALCGGLVFGPAQATAASAPSGTAEHGATAASGAPPASTTAPTVIDADAPDDALRRALARARDGDVIEVRGGVQRGPFRVDAVVRLLGSEGAVLDGGGDGDVVHFTVAGGELRGFTIRGSGSRSHTEDSAVRAEGRVTIADNRIEDVLYGVNLKAAPDSVIVDNVIEGRDIHIARRGDGIRIWESHGTRIEGNRVLATRDVVIWYSEDLEIRDNEVEDGRYGLHYMYSHNSRIEGNRLTDNAVGGYLMYSSGLTVQRNVLTENHGPSGYGLAFKDSDDVTIRDNVFAGNRVGLYLDNTPSARDARNPVSGNSFAWNDIGVLLLPAVAGNQFARNAFLENGQHVALTGRGDAHGNSWTSEERSVGNYWSGYAGLDLDRDGTGDLPYRQQSLFDDLLVREPALRLFTMTPAQSAIDFAARAFPVFRPPPILEDRAPLMRPPPPAVPAPDPQSGPLMMLAALLVGSAMAVAGWGLVSERAGSLRSTPASRGAIP